MKLLAARTIREVHVKSERRERGKQKKKKKEKKNRKQSTAHVLLAACFCSVSYAPNKGRFLRARDTKAHEKLTRTQKEKAHKSNRGNITKKKERKREKQE